MEKIRRVTVKASTPIYGVIDAPIYGLVSDIKLSTEQIRKCIVQKASVKELLSNGQYKELDLTNYNILEKVEVQEAPVQEVVEPEILNEKPVYEKNDEEVEEVVESESVDEEVTEDETEVEDVVEELPSEPSFDDENIEEESESGKDYYNKKKHRR